ncbi:hypothetical protein HNY73_009818 [Argiope bruennichi]|uniref:Uncharacterized protein n=1 Tax=Argiope bruennichi TaxID=94029 RepID=A0A8T0FAT7_ARGBR|nr:hypothetical protein HNY73_009818 [Argiope bruennichi]
MVCGIQPLWRIDQKYFVKYVNSGSTETLEAHEILPLDRFCVKNGDILGKRASTEASNSFDTSTKSQAKDLNFEMYSVGEAIKKTKKEIGRLLQSVNRNSERNEAACALIKQKVVAQNNLLKSLEAKERRISDEINKKKNHSKIAMF